MSDVNGGGHSEPGWRRGVRMPAEARREQLLDAAAKVILEHGFDALSMESAANAAGVSRTLAYSYFGSLDGLLNELFAREFSAVYDRIGPALSDGGTFEDRIRRKVSAYFGFIEERRDILIQLRANVHGARHREERRQRWSVWESYVAEIIRQEFVVDDAIARPLARILMNIDNTCVNIWYQSGLPRKLMEDVCCRFQLAGLSDFLVRRRGETQPELDDGSDRSLSPQAAAILERARSLVVSAGPDGLTMRDLAAHCGLRPAALYVHFQDKASIADHLYDAIVADYCETLAAAMASPTGNRAAGVANALVDFTLRHRSVYTFAVRHGSLRDWSLRRRDDVPPSLVDTVCDGLVLSALQSPEVSPVAETWTPVIDAAMAGA